MKSELKKLIDELMDSEIVENQILGSLLLSSETLSQEERKEKIDEWIKKNFSDDNKMQTLPVEVMANVIKANALLAEKTITRRIEKI